MTKVLRSGHSSTAECMIDVSVEKDSFKVVLWWHVAVETLRTPKAVDYDLEQKRLNKFQNLKKCL
jgi:hypothetical protein